MYQAGAVAAVGLATMAACSQNKKQAVGMATGGIATVAGIALALYDLFKKGVNKASEIPKWLLEEVANRGRQLIGALKDAMNSLLPGLGKLLEPLESFFDWLEKNAGSVARVIVMVVGGYIVLKVIRR